MSKKNKKIIFKFGLLTILLLILLTPSSSLLAQPCPMPGQVRDSTGVCITPNCPIAGQMREPDGICRTPTTTTTNTDKGTAVYKFLAPLFGQTEFNASKSNAFSSYLNIIIKVLIGIAAILAMIMIVMGGIQYMTSELFSGKQEGKRRITNALIGLLIALSAYVILFTINPNLLKTIDPSDESQFASTSLEFADYEGDLEGSNPIPPLTASGPADRASITALQAKGVYCPGGGGANEVVAIAKSFIGKVTYSQALRDKVNSSTIFLDCSSFVTKVYQCAGLPNPGGTTTGIFAAKNRAPFKADGKLDVNSLMVGDLVGWVPGDWKNSKGENTGGHVLMYVGGGMFIDSRGCGLGKDCSQVAPNRSIRLEPTIMNKIKWINRI